MSPLTELGASVSLSALTVGVVAVVALLIIERKLPPTA